MMRMLGIDDEFGILDKKKLQFGVKTEISGSCGVETCVIKKM